MSGTLIKGRSADGSDAVIVEGVYVNPNNPNEWSSTPYKNMNTLKLTQEMCMSMEIFNYMDRHGMDLKAVYKQIKNKESDLPSRCRSYVLEFFDDKGNFIENDKD